MTGVDSIQAMGPWVVVEPEASLKKTEGGIYLPDGNMLERVGHAVAVVKSAGTGRWVKKNKDKDKEVFEPMTVKPGERVAFRGHIKEANIILGTKCCFLHMDDLVGVLDDDAKLTPSMPYDN